MRIQTLCTRVPRNGMGAAPAATATNEPLSRTASSAPAYNAYVAECPSRQVLDALSDKWVTLVLTALDQPWYGEKTEPAFEDMLIKLRRTLIAARFSAAGPAQPTTDEIRAVTSAWAAAAA